MGKLLVLFVFVLLTYVSSSYCLELDSFLLGALDDTRLALESTTKTKFVTVKSGILPIKKTGITLGRRRRYRYRVAAKGKWKPSPPRPRPTKRMKVPLNKQLQATNQIEKGIRDAGVMSHGQNINSLKQHIIKACSSKEYVFARQMLGHAIYNFAKAESSKRRGRRAATSPAKSIIDEIQRRIGNSNFDRLMARDGLVTLGFAIDTTGSMSGEINDARQIATDIVNWPLRTFDVDYILSPFNDPPQSSGYAIQHGPANYYETSQKSNFLQMLRSLRARGGGDCEELAIEGIQNIFSSSIQYQSPIYVFTDAGAKDATPDNVDALKVMADGYQSAINFFLSNAGCMNKKAISLYESLAEATGGQILYFSGTSKLNKMSDFVTKGLIGGTNIPVIPNNRVRRSSGSTEYAIQVDNSMDTLSATVMTGAASNSIQLRNPAGTLQLSGKTDTGKGSLFLVQKPAPGVWKLTVPPSSGGHFVTARAVSEENIDFEYFFIVESKIGRKSKQILTNSPLKRKQANVVITVPAHSKTIPSSYKIHIVNNAFKLPKRVSIKQQGRSPGRYAGQFVPPSHEFKIILEGKTKEGVSFKRTCPGIVKPSTALIHVFSAPRGFIIHAGSSRTTTILFAVNNFGSNEAFDVKVKELKNSVQRFTKRLFVVSGRMSLFPVVFKAPRDAKRGTTHEAVVSVVGQRSKTRASMLVQLLVV